MNTGILEASNLCWKLALVELGFEQRRNSFTLRNPFARFARDAVFWLITHSRFLERRANRQVSQLDQHYRNRSWLSKQADSSGGPPPSRNVLDNGGRLSG